MKKINYISIILAAIWVLQACGAESNSGNEESATDGRWEEIKESGEIVVGTSGTLFPASYYEDDTLTGYDVELMREAAARMDLDITFETMGIDSMLPA
ncbi:transporter substrate-binding domain-containing protein, partial [Oceanobacillus massiliensis]